MERGRELRTFCWPVAALAAAWWLPVGDARFDGAVRASVERVRSYAREHVVLCLVPALWIAGGIAAFVRKGPPARSCRSSRASPTWAPASDRR